MIYQHVCVEAIAHTLPDEIVTSAQIETLLEPLYRRLRLPEGRLELMTGIVERRFWPRGMKPSEKSVETAQKALQMAKIDGRQIGALVHGSVCRDFLEPATACGVHHRLGLSNQCAVYDVSNACLGLLNGVVQVANMIELGQIRAGLVVGTESGRTLVESTIEHLNADHSLSRNDIKTAFASLTIGSGSAAVVLAHRDLSRTNNRLLGGVLHAATEHCQLCQGDVATVSGQGPVAGGQRSECEGGQHLPSPASGGHHGVVGAGGEGGLHSSSLLLMQTDSESLMREGVAAAKTAFSAFLAEMHWSREQIDKTFCHQVGRAHHRLLFESLELDQRKDYATFEHLGNTGAVALPTAASLGIEHGHVKPNDRVALLGIGSGINVVMLGLQWARDSVP